VAVELSRDSRRTWTTVAHAELAAEQAVWRIAGPPGLAHVRVRSEDGEAVSRTRRIRVVPGIADIRSDETFAVSLATDGSLRTWGKYPSGMAPAFTVRRRPRTLKGFPAVRSIAVAGTQLLAVTKDTGEVLTWGDPDSVDAGAPPVVVATPVPGIVGADRVRAYFRRSYALMRDGSVLAWGSNVYGALGDGTETSRDVPVDLPELNGAKDVALGLLFGVALFPDGSLSSWGWNVNGQLGDGSFDSHAVPASVSGVDGVIAVSARDTWAMALRGDGTVWTWGGNRFGRLGRAAGDADPKPAPVPGLFEIVAVHCGTNAGYALRSDGVLFAWGLNDRGELGDGSTEWRASPGPSVASVDRIFGGMAQMHVLTWSGQHLAWGANDWWMLGDGTLKNRVSPVAIGKRSKHGVTVVVGMPYR
jgi:alpha-tubulin suppressor-like RCC1 family protein